MEAGDYALTRRTCFVASHLEVVAVAGPLTVDFVVCFGWGGFFVFFFDFFFPSKRTHTACYKYEAALPHLPLY